MGGAEDSYFGGAYTSLFGAAEDPPKPSTGTGTAATATSAEEPGYLASLFGGSAEAEVADGPGEEDDGLFGITSLFAGASQDEEEKEGDSLPPLPKPLPPPPPPEPPPPPISRLRPWAPQLRAASQPREGSRVEMREPPKTDPKMPPPAIDRYLVTADRRRALPKPLAKKDADILRGADVTLCVADAEDQLSEPESQKSAESISGEIARSWDPATQDSRWHYSRDTAVPFSDPWRPLNWSDEQWMRHLKETGAYMPRAHQEALEEKAEQERLELEAKMAKATAVMKMNTDQASLQEMAYSEIQKELTPRGLAMQKFMPVPSNDPVMRPALADALAAYKSLPRGAFDDLRMELEGEGHRSGTGTELASTPWTEKDACLDLPGRAWL